MLYAAGATLDAVDYEDEHKHVPRFILDDQKPMLPLLGLCRRWIRAHLLSPTGANHNNLITAVPQLPWLPNELKEYMLFRPFSPTVDFGELWTAIPIRFVHVTLDPNTNKLILLEPEDESDPE